MSSPRAESLDRRIPAGELLLIDTSVALAYLAGGERDSDAATELFDRIIATGRNAAMVSVVTVGELLVRPFAKGMAAVAVTEGFLRHFGEIRVVDVTYDIAREAARLRAVTGLAMPDALIIASAIAHGADRVVTNDRTWVTRLGPAAPDLVVTTLAI